MKSTAAGHRFPFLGGPITGFLLVFAQGAGFYRVLTWFALVPLLVSLHRHRENAPARLVHAVSTGLVAGGFLFLPLFDSWRLEWVRAGREPWAAAVVAVFSYLGSAALLSLLWACFGGLSGTLLRHPAPGRCLLGLPALWTGLEYLYLEGAPGSTSRVLLGAFLDSSQPEAQVASFCGVEGLSFLLVLSAAAFFLALREGIWWRQVLLAAVGCGVFLGAYGHGRSVLDGVPRGAAAVPVAVVQSLAAATAGRDESPLELVRPLLPAQPRLLLVGGEEPLGPVSAALPPDHEYASWSAFARKEGLALLGTVEARPAPRGAPSGRGGEDGIRILAQDAGGRPLRRSDGEPWDSRSGAVLPSPAGKLGIGLGRDFHRESTARRLVAQGAEVLVHLGRGPPGGRVLDLGAWRAVENRRWLLRATSGARCVLVSPQGSRIAEAPAGLSFAALEDMDPRREIGFFTRSGWLLAPACVPLAAWLVWLSRRRRPIARSG